MPSIQNVERRGAVYYWRRSIRFQDGKFLSLRVSLRTTDQYVARRMACAMTTKSETLRMTLDRVTDGSTLTMEQKATVCCGISVSTSSGIVSSMLKVASGSAQFGPYPARRHQHQRLEITSVVSGIATHILRWCRFSGQVAKLDPT